MMKWLHAHRTQVAFLVVLLALVASSVVMFRSIMLVSQAQEALLQNMRLLRELDRLRVAMIDAETAQRGYLLTGNPRYLQPYYSAVNVLQRELEKVRTLIGEKSEHSAGAERIEALVDTKLNELKETIELRKSAGFGAARRVVETDQGKKTMDEIRALISQLEDAVNVNVTGSAQRSLGSIRTMLITFSIGSLLTLLLFLAVFYVLARDVTRRRRSQAVLRDANDRLAEGLQALEERNLAVTVLSEMSGALQSCVAVEEAFAAVSVFCRQLFPDCSGVLYLMHPPRNYLETAAAWGAQKEGLQQFSPNDCWALRRGEPYQIENPDTELICNHIGAGASHPYLCLPLQAQGETMGLLYFEFPTGLKEDAQYYRRVRQLALGTGKQIALAVGNIRLRDTLRNQSVRDPLTGLFNRRYLEETLEREVAHAARNNTPYCVVMIDVDHFKKVNDQYGHEAGDMVLREFGALLRTQGRISDTACRYGGEEFTLLLPDTTIEGALQQCERLRKLIRELHMTHRQHSLGTITVSMGVASFPQSGKTADRLIGAADSALYQAKREGRDRVVAAQAGLPVEAANR